MDNLLRFNKKQKYIVFDTETEGLNLVWHRPFQVSWVEGCGKETVAKHDYYVHWDDFKISDGAAKVTRFDWAKYKKEAQNPQKVWNEFKKYLYDPSYVCVCQNALGFDVYILRNLQRLCGEKADFSYLSRLIDTKALASAVFKKVNFDPNYETKFLEWQYRMASIHERGLKTNQELLLKHYGIPYEKERLHEALYDVEMLWEIFKKMVWDIEVPNLVKKT